MPHRATLARYLFAMFGISLLALGGLMASTTISSFHRERDRAASALAAVARFNADVQSQTVPGTVQLLEGLASDPGLIVYDPTRCQTQLAGLAGLENRGHVHVLRHDGTQSCSLQSPTLPPTALTPGPWFQEVLATGKTATGPTGIDPLSGQPAITVAVPVWSDPVAGTPTDPMGSVTGVLAAVVYTGGTPLMVPPGSSPTTVLMEISADRSLVLATSPTAPFHQGTTSGTWLAGPSSAGRTVTDRDGVTRLYEEVTASNGWHVLAGLPVQVAFGPARSDLYRNLGMTTAVLLVVAAMGVVLNRRLALPIRRLQHAIEAASGDDMARAPVEGPAEVASLAEAFNATITQRRILMQQLAHQALHDPLTDLPNRALLVDRLNLALARRRRVGGWVALTFVDLDHFKLVNDSYGHPTGDLLLKEFARRLQAAMRTSDTVARLGGDEFVVVSEGSGNPQGAAIAERLRECFAASFLLEGKDVMLSGSIGVAIGDGNNTADELIANADKIMYEAKQRGRRTYALYERPVRSDQISRIEAERDLRQAITNNELLLHYQPQCRVRDSQVVSVEALLRWRNPSRGLIFPDDFLPVAEETGMIQTIGERTLVEACRQVAGWRHLLGITVPVSVNISSRQLARSDLATTVGDTLEATGMQPSELSLEITQGALIVDPTATARRLADLRALGVRLSVDNFGTARSSLIAHLRTLPIHEIKIDRSFIAGIADDPAAAAIVDGVVRVGHALGLTVVAQGVETEAQLDVLRDLACDVAQGYYLSEPLPPEELGPALVGENGSLARFPSRAEAIVRIPQAP
ncbi:MAG TPA: EAL domain-containing protein [Actinomycetota bacterium]|nr:EAL domain-containing protein [Actinomycetota bacterium]